MVEPSLAAALCANVDETTRVPEFSVEGSRGIHDGDSEVVAKATRRRFSAEYKRRILQEAEKARSSGEIGALLRREGLYSSHLTTWRAARKRGELAGLA